MIKWLAGVHPGVWLTIFFVTLVVMNITFFAIAASQDVRMAPPEVRTPGGSGLTTSPAVSPDDATRKPAVVP